MTVALLALFPNWLLLENRLVYAPSRSLSATPRAYGLPFERVKLVADDGVKLAAWALPYAARAPWLVYFHGNGGNVSSYLSFTTALYGLGLNVLMLEYRGYGESEGVPSERGLYKDALAAYHYLLGEGVSPEGIALYGFSLGSGVAIDLASKVEVGALVVEAAYTSIPDVARSLYGIVPNFLVRNRFASKDKIARVKAPVLFIHSAEDRTVPYAHGKALYALARGPKAFVELKGGHVAMLDAKPDKRVLSTIAEFLRQLKPGATTPRA